VHGALVEATIGNTVALSLHARGSQTKLLHFHAVAKNARQRPDRFHARTGRPHCIVEEILECACFWPVPLVS